MKRYQSKSAICPFYHSESAQKIYCEGVTDGNSIHMAFDNTARLKDYELEYCYCKYYKYCLIADMLLHNKYDT